MKRRKEREGGRRRRREEIEPTYTLGIDIVLYQKHPLRKRKKRFLLPTLGLTSHYTGPCPRSRQ